jgi:hypothetical protein
VLAGLEGLERPLPQKQDRAPVGLFGRLGMSRS